MTQLSNSQIQRVVMMERHPLECSAFKTSQAVVKSKEVNTYQVTGAKLCLHGFAVSVPTSQVGLALAWFASSHSHRCVVNTD